MARITSPVRFIQWTGLFKDVKDKHTADGTASILTIFLTENDISLTDDATAVADAEAKQKEFKKLERDSEKELKTRDSLFTPVFKDHTDSVQYLKKFYRKNIGKLGDWGVTVNGKKIVYPVDFEQKKDAVIFFIDHHLGLPVGTSPLIAFLADNDIDFTANRADAVSAGTANDDAEQMRKDKEERRAERDVLIDPVKTDLTGIGQFLIEHFATNPNKAGDWGYTVDNSPQGSVTREGVINLSSSKVLRQLATEGILTNIGNTVLNLYKGPLAEGTPTPLDPGKHYVIKRGFGTITLLNTSDKDKGGYQGTFSS